MLQQFGGTLAATLMDSKTHAALRQRLRGYLKANPSVTHKQVGLAIGVKSPSVTNFVNAKRGLKASRMEALAEFLKAPTISEMLGVSADIPGPPLSGSDPIRQTSDTRSGATNQAGQKEGAPDARSLEDRLPHTTVTREAVYRRMETAARAILGDVEYLRDTEPQPARKTRKQSRARAADPSGVRGHRGIRR